MLELSTETRATYVARAITDMRRINPDLSWRDIVAINDGPGWYYDLPWHERGPRGQPGERELVCGERPEHRALVWAWYQAREKTYH